MHHGPKLPWVLLLVAFLLMPFARADSPPVGLDAFAQSVAAARRAAAACAQIKAACRDAHLPPPGRVQGAHGVFAMRWSFAESALQRASEASDADRRQSMGALRYQLDALLEEASQPAGPTAREADAELARGQREAAAILARPEFRAADGPGWLDRQMAHIQEAVLRLFTGMDRLGKRAPWLAPLVEWSCFALAAAGLLWYVRQSLRRQALQLSLEGTLPTAGVRGQDAAGWRRMAAEFREAGAWRESIHCVYWAAIALLEERRTWRPNPTRTPREYLRLLRPGSETQANLRELTRLLETTWYGAGPASEMELRQAEVCLQRLLSGKDRPVRTAGPHHAASGSPA